MMSDMTWREDQLLLEFLSYLADKEIDRLGMELDNTVRELADMKDKRDQLREALEMFINLTDIQNHYPLEVNLARAALKEIDNET